jgi:hypothetical protein
VQPQLRTVALPNNAISGSENSGRFGIQAAGAWETTRLTTGYDDLTSSAWTKSSGLTITANSLANTADTLDAQLDKLTHTQTGTKYANTRININTGETIDVSVVLAGSGSVRFWLQNTNDFTEIKGVNVTLTSTPQRVILTNVQRPTGTNNSIQLVIGDIASTETVHVGGARTRATDTGATGGGTGGTTTPVTVAALSSWAKGAGVSMVDNGDTFQKITTTNASYVNTPVAVLAGQTYRYTATLRGTGDINLFWQQRNSPYSQYATKAVTLTGTAQIITFDTLIPSDGTPAQIGIGSIATTDTVYVKDLKIEQVNSSTGTPVVTVNPPHSDFKPEGLDPTKFEAFGGFKTRNECAMLASIGGIPFTCTDNYIGNLNFAPRVKTFDIIVKPVDIYSIDAFAIQKFPVFVETLRGEDPGVTFRVVVNDGTINKYVTPSDSANADSYPRGIKIMRPAKIGSSFYDLGTYKDGVYSVGFNYEALTGFFGEGKNLRIQLLAYSKDLFLGASSVVYLKIMQRNSQNTATEIHTVQVAADFRLFQDQDQTQFPKPPQRQLVPIKETYRQL